MGTLLDSLYMSVYPSVRPSAHLFHSLLSAVEANFQQVIVVVFLPFLLLSNPSFTLKYLFVQVSLEQMDELQPSTCTL